MRDDLTGDQVIIPDNAWSSWAALSGAAALIESEGLVFVRRQKGYETPNTPVARISFC